MLSFSPVVGIGTPPPAGECAPLPVLGERTHSLAREGLGESQFRRGDIHCGTLYIYVVCKKNQASNSIFISYASINCVALAALYIVRRRDKFQ